MIAPMRKYTFLVFAEEYAEFLRALQGLGVVHVEEKKTAEDDDTVKDLLARATHLSRALGILKKRKPADPKKAEKNEVIDATIRTVRLNDFSSFGIW